jgi:hypothetical protein
VQKYVAAGTKRCDIQELETTRIGNIDILLASAGQCGGTGEQFDTNDATWTAYVWRGPTKAGPTLRFSSFSLVFCSFPVRRLPVRGNRSWHHVLGPVFMLSGRLKRK